MLVFFSGVIVGVVVGWGMVFAVAYLMDQWYGD
jgi:hypothetical protein